jgi:hypothetical protein
VGNTVRFAAPLPTAFLARPPEALPRLVTQGLRSYLFTSFEAMSTVIMKPLVPLDS